MISKASYESCWKDIKSGLDSLAGSKEEFGHASCVLLRCWAYLDERENEIQELKIDNELLKKSILLLEEKLRSK